MKRRAYWRRVFNRQTSAKAPGQDMPRCSRNKPHSSVWLEQGEQADNRGDEVRQEVFGD